MSKSILLVEDDMLVRESISLALELKYNVLQASNCSKAVQQLGNPIDLVIVDYILPDGNGFELLKEIRKLDPSLPVIMLTAYSTEDLAMEALRNQVTDFIKKPSSIRYLMTKIAELLKEDMEEWHERDDPFVEPAKREEFIMDSVAFYIEKNYSKNLHPCKVASRINMNRTKFCTVFKKRFGQSFSSYLNTMRVKKAAELLKRSDLNIGDVAQFVGFRDASYFSKIFKKIYGVPPKQYKKILTQGNL